MTILFSCAEPFFDAAAEELLRFAVGANVQRVGLDAGIVDGVDLGVLAEASEHGPIVFLRHLAQVDQVVTSADGAAIVDAARNVAVASGVQLIGVHVWPIEPGAPKAEAVRAGIVEALAADVATTRRGASHSLSVALGNRAAYVCLTPAVNELSNWPGGRVRLTKPSDQISRSEFKLEELAKLRPLRVMEGTRALDLGASPGGWTRVLRRAGSEVWAVDPADLDPRVVGDPLVHHVRTTAGRFLAETNLRFDLVVNDMRTEPKASTDLLVSAAAKLDAGVTAVATLKVSRRHALRTVREALHNLERSYDLVFARQLFHNKDEVTVMATRR